jgi:DNA-binding MarR family transcriptional regulator
MAKSSAPRPPSSAAAELSKSVSQTVRGWIRLGKEEGRTAGLSFPQLIVLGNLLELGSAPVTTWAESVGASASSMTGLLDGLASEGLVRREHDSADRRKVLITLTPKGTRTAQRIRSRFERRWTRYCEGIPAEELRRATEVLQRVLERMGPDLAKVPELRLPHAPAAPRPRETRAGGP